MDVWVAAGTVFLDVLIWRFAISTTGPECSSVAKHSQAAALYRLKGHDGSVHRWELPDAPHSLVFHSELAHPTCCYI